MSSNISNQIPYLRTTREFPSQDKVLGIELNKAYLDIANVVNSRTIGLFAVGRSAITGEAWYLRGGRKQQTIRQAYQFTSTANIPHGINTQNFPGFTIKYGDYSDGTNWYGLISGTSVAIPGQISFYCTPTNIVFVTGAGAPALTSGIIVLEWLAQV